MFMSTKKRIALGLSSVVVVLLSGCASSYHDFAADISQPRPVTTEASEAAKILYGKFPQYLDKQMILSVDTAIWDDEEGMVLGGFHEGDIYYDLYKAQSEEKRAKAARSLMLRHGTVPHAMRENWLKAQAKGESGASVSDAVLTAWGFSNRVAGIGATQAGASGFSSFGIAMGIAGWLLTPDDSPVGIEPYYLMKDLYGTVNLSYSLPAKKMTGDDKQKREQIATDLVKQTTDILVERGFIRVGNPQNGAVFEYRNRFTWTPVVYQKLENDALGCPKVLNDEKQKLRDICRVEFYSDEESMTLQEANGELNAGLLTKAFVDTHAGFEMPESPSDSLKKEGPALHLTVLKELVKHNPAIRLYLPAEQDQNGRWIPQRVLDQQGEHFFVVTVKRLAGARTTADLVVEGK